MRIVYLNHTTKGFFSGFLGGAGFLGYPSVDFVSGVLFDREN